MSGLIPYLLITPVQLMLLLVLILPSLGVVYLSLFESSFGTGRVFVAFDNFLTIFGDSGFWRALLNNVILVNIVVYGELLLALGMAVLFAAGFFLQRLWVSLVIAPYAVSAVIAVIMWQYLLEPDIGLLNYALQSLGFEQILWPIDPIHAFAVVCLLEIWLQTPFSFLILYSAIISVPSELHEAARIDGATEFQTFRMVTFPLIIPAILVALMFRYIFAFRTFDVVWIMTQGGPFGATDLLSIYLFRHGFRYYEFGIGSATAVVMTVLTILLASYYLRILYLRMFSHAR